MGRLFGQRDAELFPECETHFFFKTVDGQLSFARDEKGRGAGLVLHQNGADTSFKKIPDEVFEVAKPSLAVEYARGTNSALQGCWRGVIAGGSSKLHLVVRSAAPVAGKYRAELDVVEQRGYGQPLWVIYDPARVKLVVITGHGMFADGLNYTDTTMTGH